MLSLTRKTDYALVALAGLATQAPASVSANELATRLHLPLPALRNILKLLAHHGVVASTQGPSGGYRLARRPEQITVADVVRAIEGPIRLALCCSSGPEPQDHECRLEDSCRIKATVQRVQQRLVSFLGQVNLAQIAMDELPNGAPVNLVVPQPQHNGPAAPVPSVAAG